MTKFNISASALLGGAMLLHLLAIPTPVYAQEPASPSGGMAGMPGMSMGGPSGITNDLFVMLGSDFDRPGLLPRANYSIGLGHMFRFLKKDPFGDELTLSHTHLSLIVTFCYGLRSTRPARGNSRARAGHRRKVQ
jgi:hypothetical protein